MILATKFVGPLILFSRSIPTFTKNLRPLTAQCDSRRMHYTLCVKYLVRARWLTVSAVHQPFNRAIPQDFKNIFVMCGNRHLSTCVGVKFKCHMYDMTGYATGAPQARVALLRWLNSLKFENAHVRFITECALTTANLCIQSAGRQSMKIFKLEI